MSPVDPCVSVYCSNSGLSGLGVSVYVIIPIKTIIYVFFYKVSIGWFGLSDWIFSSFFFSVCVLSVDWVVGYVIIPKSPNMILF